MGPRAAGMVLATGPSRAGSGVETWLDLDGKGTGGAAGAGALILGVGAGTAGGAGGTPWPVSGFSMGSLDAGTRGGTSVVRGNT
ncbi:MAG: hypothetical protein HY698_11625 [Deltaproteobacteria bacterium]|nr:hypothetical protein [Deltaproteobacteria bacterium]